MVVNSRQMRLWISFVAIKSWFLNCNLSFQEVQGSKDSPNLDWCKNEVFTINNYGVDGPIKEGQNVYLKRASCNKPYLSGKHGKYIETHDGLGTCEQWKIVKAWKWL